MFGNIIGNRVGSMVAERLDGKKTIIGAVGVILYVVVVLIGKLWPEHNISGADISYEDLFGMLSGAIAVLGTHHKAHKAGVKKGMELNDHPLGV
ncbi:MAG: hypothetical protein ACWGQW_12305 [bacterium]